MATSVLIIDDDDGAREALAWALRAMGHQTFTAKNGRDGLALFNAEPADIVVTDIFMPERDGIEVVIALRERPCVPKVIAMSGGGLLRGTEVLHVAKLLGADRIMPKPVDAAKLEDVIAELLDGAGRPRREPDDRTPLALPGA